MVNIFFKLIYLKKICLTNRKYGFHHKKLYKSEESRTVFQFILYDFVTSERISEMNSNALKRMIFPSCFFLHIRHAYNSYRCVENLRVQYPFHL